MALNIVRVRSFWTSNIFVIIVCVPLYSWYWRSDRHGTKCWILHTFINRDKYCGFPTFQYLCVVSTRLVSTKQSPHFKAFYKKYPVKITFDTGAEISMIKASVAQRIGTVIKKSNQSALHADGITPLVIAGETHIMLLWDNIELASDA